MTAEVSRLPGRKEAPMSRARLLSLTGRELVSLIRAMPTPALETFLAEVV